MYLVERQEFIEFFDTFRSERHDVLCLEIELPVINLLSKQCIPDSIERRKYGLHELQTAQIFEVIYQIRNNLFHGGKDPFGDERDKELSRFGSEFMLRFVSNLLLHTCGEVRNFNDNQQLAEMRRLAELAAVVRRGGAATQ